MCKIFLVLHNRYENVNSITSYTQKLYSYEGEEEDDDAHDNGEKREFYRVVYRELHRQVQCSRKQFNFKST